MLLALQDAMIGRLKDSNASQEMVEAYKKHWVDSLEGHSNPFPCPACFMSGNKSSSLKPLPAKAGTHYVQCPVCGSQYSYEDDDF
jgi:hypothetical protein